MNDEEVFEFVKDVFKNDKTVYSYMKMVTIILFVMIAIKK